MRVTQDGPGADQHQQAPPDPPPNSGGGGSGGDGNVITDLLQGTQGLLQAYGWYLVLTLLALYLLRPSLQRLRAELSLRHANNPTRRGILDEERRRVRLQQQMDLLRAKETANTAKVEAEVEGSDDVVTPPATVTASATLDGTDDKPPTATTLRKRRGVAPMKKKKKLVPEPESS
jgi:hypothetical protein